MSDVRPFEEYKEMIKDMGKEEMIRGLYDLSARVTKQENIIKEVREILNTQLAFTSSYQLNYQSAMSIIEETKSILDKENKE